MWSGMGRSPTYPGTGPYGTTLWTRDSVCFPEPQADEFPLRLLVHPETRESHLPDVLHVEATGLKGRDLGCPERWDISLTQKVSPMSKTSLLKLIVDFFSSQAAADLWDTGSPWLRDVKILSATRHKSTRKSSALPLRQDKLHNFCVKKAGVRQFVEPTNKNNTQTANKQDQTTKHHKTHTNATQTRKVPSHLGRAKQGWDSLTHFSSSSPASSAHNNHPLTKTRNQCRCKQVPSNIGICLAVHNS